MGGVLTYSTEVARGIDLLIADPRAIFIGQSMFSANAMSQSLSAVPADRRIELPIFEDSQMGISIGLALAGVLPVTVYPRFNFLLLAINQLVNHLDVLPETGRWMPKVIIRTLVGATRPLNAGPQHSGDYTAALRAMLRHVRVEDLQKAEDVFPAYERAVAGTESVLLVEHGACFGSH